MTEMTAKYVHQNVGTQTAPDYPTLVGADGWQRLPPLVRERISRHNARYIGTMRHIRLSLAGRILAWLAAPLGKPLTPFSGNAVPIRVRVEPTSDGGTRWTRAYDFGDWRDYMRVFEASVSS